MNLRLALSTDRPPLGPALFAGSFKDTAPDLRADAPHGARGFEGVPLHFEQDREIYGEGDGAEVVYKVLSGVVRTCKFLSDGRRQIDAFYISGDLFGLELGTERSLTAEAVSDCALISYRRRAGGTLVLEDESLTQHLLSHVMTSLAHAQDHLILVGRRSALEKVAAFLMGWAVRAHNDAVVSLPMTRQDIADYLGLTIETVSRTLSQLQRERVIALPSAREIRLTDRAALRDLNA